MSLAFLACQATPPSLSSSTSLPSRAVAAQQLDVLDRQIELGVVGVLDLDAVVRRAHRLDLLEAEEAADAVIDVDDEIAGREAGRLGQRVRRLLAPLRPQQPLAEDVLLGQHDQVVGLEAVLERQHDERA